jgi:paraquat-inducible protein B
MARDITVHVFVREPFDKYVRDNSRFWNASGAKVQLGTDGLQVKLQSLRAVVFGALAFETPDDPTITQESTADHSFPLYDDEDAANNSTYKRSVPFVANFSSSVSGLEPGSPVTLRGLKIGEVSGLSLLYDHAQDNVVVPVHFTLEPERIAMLELPTGGDLDNRLRELVHRGLRVKLEASNVLIGSKQLAMDVYRDAAPGELAKQGDAYVIPVMGGSADDVATAATNLVNRLNEVPFDSIGRNLDHTLAGVNALVNDKQLSETVTELRSTLAGTRELVNNLNKGVTPAMQRLPSIANGLESSVQRTDKLLASLQTGYGGDSRFNRDVSQMMGQLSDAARSIRVLADLLARHPEALIRGRTDQGVQ